MALRAVYVGSRDAIDAIYAVKLATFKHYHSIFAMKLFESFDYAILSETSLCLPLLRSLNVV